MNKHDGKYYLQYGAPGTEFSGYGDGVYVGDHPLGPFTYQAHNPFSYKPGGFARGAGHGATFQDKFGGWRHVSTMVIGVKNNFERRLGVFPAGFDGDGVLFANTAYSDYPLYLPSAGNVDGLKGVSPGWMILNYNKPVMVSSTFGGYGANYAVDENIKTYWSAATGEAGEWFQTDLGEASDVYAIQVNYGDQDAGRGGAKDDVRGTRYDEGLRTRYEVRGTTRYEGRGTKDETSISKYQVRSPKSGVGEKMAVMAMGKEAGLYTQYMIRSSLDGVHWTVMVDKSKSIKDAPHDYIDLGRAVKARYLKIENIHVPTGKFALSGFRAFGLAGKAKPEVVKNFVVLRGDKDNERRSAWLKWMQSDDAVGYTIYMGVSPEKLYNSVQLYGVNEYYFTGMDKTLPYYFQIEAYNEAGIGTRTGVVKVE